MDGWSACRWVASALLFACGPDVGGGGATDGSASSGGICDVGELGCTCTTGGACNDGLECREGVCLPGETSSGESSANTSGDPTSSATMDVTTSPTSGTTTDTGIPEGCGDDELEAPEECDDGNNLDGDGCNANCTLGGQQVWMQVFDGPAAITDWGQRVALDADDNVFVAAVTFGGSNDNDGWVIKLDDDGQIEWEDFYDSGMGTSNDGFVAIDVAPGGEVIVGGYAWNEFTQDRILRCYSNDGNELWTLVDPGMLYDEGIYEVAVDPAGDIVALGTAQDPSDGTDLTWLAKFTIDGDNVWTETYPVGMYSRAYALAVDGDGSIVYGAGDSYLFLRKLSPDAEEEWLHEAGLGPWSVGGIAIDLGGDVFVGGSLDNAPAAARLARHDVSDGALVWDEAWLGSDAAGAYSAAVALDAEGRPIMVGAASDGVGTTSIAFVRKHDAVGDPVWLFETDGGPTTTFAGVAVDSTGHVVASGHVQQESGYDDVMIVKLTP